MEGSAEITAIRLFVLLITAAGLVAMAVRRIRVPYTVALVLLGLAVAAVTPDSVHVTPELVLAVLLPGLVFEAAYKIDLQQLRRTLGGIAILAAPGVVLTAAVVALVLHLGTGLDLGLGFVVGAMVGATDPAAVIATFREAGVRSSLATAVEGESLLNDGTGLVVFAIAVRAVESQVSVLDGLVSFVLTVVVSAVLGAGVGWLASRLIATVDDHLIELTLSVSAAYGTYLVADAFHESGVIATVVAGVVLGNYGRRIGLSQRSEAVLDVVWEFLAFLLTAVVFLLVGLAITVPSLLDALPSIAWGIVGILLGRAIVVYGLLGGVSRFTRVGGHGAIALGSLHVLFWSGLRGAVAVAMALSLPLGFAQRDLLQEITFGVVLFTLLVQGTTVSRVVRRFAVPVGPAATIGVAAPD